METKQQETGRWEGNGVSSVLSGWFPPCARALPCERDTWLPAQPPTLWVSFSHKFQASVSKSLASPTPPAEAMLITGGGDQVPCSCSCSCAGKATRPWTAGVLQLWEGKNLFGCDCTSCFPWVHPKEEAPLSAFFEGRLPRHRKYSTSLESHRGSP